MIAIKLKDLQVGQKYYIHQVKDEDTHEPVSRKYKAVCTADYSTPGGWYDFGFGSVKGINVDDIARGLGISIEEDGWGIYKYYLCEKDEIIERVKLNAVNTALREITGDHCFKFY
jgi:hypothetical protein